MHNLLKQVILCKPEADERRCLAPNNPTQTHIIPAVRINVPAVAVQLSAHVRAHRSTKGSSCCPKHEAVSAPTHKGVRSRQTAGELPN